MRTYAATANAEKLRELKALFKGSPLQVTAYRAYAGVAEDAESYTGNALLKARALAARLRDRGAAAAVLADDSGLEVDALGGRPGVHSARYGGGALDWAQRRALLLAELRGVPPYRRTARFVCALVFIPAHGDPLVVTGDVTGYILEAELGAGGFGYDPVFLYPPSGRSFGALSEKEKNAVSHRCRAAQALLTLLRGT